MFKKVCARICARGRKIRSKMMKKSKEKKKQAEITEKTLSIGDVEWQVPIYNFNAQGSNEPVEEEPVFMKIENIIRNERLNRNYSINRRNAIRKKQSF